MSGNQQHKLNLDVDKMEKFIHPNKESNDETGRVKIVEAQLYNARRDEAEALDQVEYARRGRGKAEKALEEMKVNFNWKVRKICLIFSLQKKYDDARTEADAAKKETAAAKMETATVKKEAEEKIKSLEADVARLKNELAASKSAVAEVIPP